MSGNSTIRRAGDSKAMRAVRDDASFYARIGMPVPKPNTDALIADIWLDTLCAIKRRGHAGTISQVLDDIEAAMERADAIENANA